VRMPKSLTSSITSGPPTALPVLVFALIALGGGLAQWRLWQPVSRPEPLQRWSLRSWG
jgi:hypothetical protein